MTPGLRQSLLTNFYSYHGVFGTYTGEQLFFIHPKIVFSLEYIVHLTVNGFYVRHWSTSQVYVKYEIPLTDNEYILAFVIDAELERVIFAVFDDVSDSLVVSCIWMILALICMFVEGCVIRSYNADKYLWNLSSPVDWSDGPSTLRIFSHAYLLSQWRFDKHQHCCVDREYLKTVPKPGFDFVHEYPFVAPCVD